jgi:hypothetical protein
MDHARLGLEPDADMRGKRKCAISTSAAQVRLRRRKRWTWF